MCRSSRSRSYRGREGYGNNKGQANQLNLHHRSSVYCSVAVLRFVSAGEIIGGWRWGGWCMYPEERVGTAAGGEEPELSSEVDVGSFHFLVLCCDAAGGARK